MPERDAATAEALLWQLRAEAWRRVACEYAAGRRKPYGVPVTGALRLRQECASFDWGDPEAESVTLATVTTDFHGMPSLGGGVDA